MGNKILILLFALLTSVFFIKLVLNYDNSRFVESSIDNNEYLIRNKYHSKQLEQDTADTLAKINLNIHKLLEKSQDDPYFMTYLRSRYSSASISEAAIDDNYTTYTINKQQIHICLRSRDQARGLYEMNDLMYVTIHELAHMCNFSKSGESITGHGREFQEKFKFLVNKAIQLGIYKYYDYTNLPKEYCGMNITSHILG